MNKHVDKKNTARIEDAAGIKDTVSVEKAAARTTLIPLVFKIVTIFTIFLLVANFVSNYINLMLNRGELLKLMNQLLLKDLKEIYTFSTNQYEIYSFNQDLNKAVQNIEESAVKELKRSKSLAIGVKQDGSIFFSASPSGKVERFEDAEALNKLIEGNKNQNAEGAFTFVLNRQQYFGMYKFNPKWEVFLIRAEETSEFNRDSWIIFRNIAIIIVLITVVCVVLGVFLIRFILRFVGIITAGMMRMQQNQKIELLDLKGAPDDDITYLGVSFNALASTIDNLLTIFKKFVAQDVAKKAYEEKTVRLEGKKQELTILFSDIKGFTFMTETLGTDIIKLLNLQYDRAISHIHVHGGIIGSIIGDALLAVYGVIPEEGYNKSYHAIKSAYLVHEVAANLRKDMHTRREEIVQQRGALTQEEERIYRAVLIEVGVGIDGGEVFYGNIGSYERMTNTVIGDNVNSASRLEGLTRIYRVPVICSEYVKQDVETTYDEFYFLELDQVQVKGKTEGKKIYWPIQKSVIDADLKKDVEFFSRGLSAYYAGEWEAAYKDFSACTLPLADVFKERTEGASCPPDWKGIWAMKTK